MLDVIAVEKEPPLSHLALYVQLLPLVDRAQRHRQLVPGAEIGLADHELQLARAQREHLPARAFLSGGRARRRADPDAARLLLLAGEELSTLAQDLQDVPRSRRRRSVAEERLVQDSIVQRTPV